MGDSKIYLGCLLAFLQLMLVTPLWYYLIYRLLQAANADTAMWVCYWVYVPLGLTSAVVRALWEAS